MKALFGKLSRWLRSLPVLLGVLLIASVQLFSGAIPDAIGYWNLKQFPQLIVTILGILGVLVLGISSLVNREPTSRILASRSVITQKDTRRGLILLASRFDPRGQLSKELPAIDSEENRKKRAIAIDDLLKKAIETRDTSFLDIENSNLNQALRAIRVHWKPENGETGLLEHIWLLSTGGSTQSAEVLALHLQNQSDFKAKIHHAGDKKWLEVPGKEGDNKELIERTKDTAARVFKEASESPFSLKSYELVADVTGGFKTMTVGLTLACLARDRDLQYVSSVVTDMPTIYRFETKTGGQQ